MWVKLRQKGAFRVRFGVSRFIGLGFRGVDFRVQG